VKIATFLEMCWTLSEDQERRVAGEMTGGSEKLSVLNLGKSDCSTAIWLGRNYFVHILFGC
jgi:hypothetical protein